MKTQQHTNVPVCILPIHSVFFTPPFACIRSFLLLIEMLSSSRKFGLTLYHAHILASTSLLLNTAVGYQSLSSLYSKRFLWS